MGNLELSLLPPIQTTFSPPQTTTVATSSVSDVEFEVDRALLLLVLYSSTLSVLIALLVVSFLMHLREQRITRSNKNASNGTTIEEGLLNPWAASASIFAASNGDVSSVLRVFFCEYRSFYECIIFL